MKTPHEWADMYFKDKVRNLPDLVKMIQDETKIEILAAINKSIDELTTKPGDNTSGLKQQ